MMIWRKLVFVVLGGACGLSAQSPNPLSAEVKWTYTTIKNNLTKLADKMPAEKYSYRPTRGRDFCAAYRSHRRRKHERLFRAQRRAQITGRSV